MSAVRLAEQLGISSRNVEKNIKKLKELYEVDLIVKQNQKIKKGKSRIEITKKYTDFLEQNEKVKIKK